MQAFKRWCKAAPSLISSSEALFFSSFLQILCIERQRSMAGHATEHSVRNATALGDADHLSLVTKKATETTAVLHSTEAQPSMALIPASAAPSTALSTTAAAGTHSSSSQPTIHEGEEPWPFVTKALMVAVISSQTTAAASSTLLDVFLPVVEGWGAAHKESKRWKERAESYVAEHRKHKAELTHKHDTLHDHSKNLQRSLAERESKVHELESHITTLRSSESSLEKKLAETDAAKQTLALEREERKKEADAMAKSAQEAKAAYDRFRQEVHNKAKAHDAESNTLRDKMKENDVLKAKLEERLGSAMVKNASYEEQLAQKNQEATSLQNQVSQLNTSKGALERQLAFYQRLPTRRF
ncbi:hypothetical protein L7F22_026212 [Adiantum nelumboides]|nr:hypothetical protein [Adiantum nelumboides]